MAGTLTASGAIALRDVSKVYDPNGAAVHALDRWNLDVAPGEFLAIVGPSGCGKTTLLNAIAGFDTITGGEIQLDGRVLSAPGRAARPGPDRVVVFQHSALFPWKTVAENIAFGPRVQGRGAKLDAMSEALALLERAELGSIAHVYPGALSSGARRRVEFVRALASNPTVLLLDEPFRALDAITKSAMHEYLGALLAKEPRTVVLITHDIDEAILLADRVVISTTRPARVKEIIDVRIARPRGPLTVAMEEFAAYRATALAAVEEEAQLAFAAGEREGA
jgi:NitT/TauT family transport system ATP-binding protein